LSKIILYENLIIGILIANLVPDFCVLFMAISTVFWIRIQKHILRLNLDYKIKNKAERA